MPQPIQSAFGVRVHVSLHRGTRHPNDFRGLLASDPAVEKPDCQHFVANEETGVARAILMDDTLLFFAELDTTPSHRAPPRHANQKQDFLDRLTHSYTRIHVKRECLIQPPPKYSRLQ